MTRAETLRFPPSLTETHVQELLKRGISKEFALQSGVRTIADNEARQLGFETSIPVDQRRNGLQGICFPYRDLASAEEISWRLKPDQKFFISEKQAKYISCVGDGLRAYFPSTTTREMKDDPRFQVIMTEGEYKALSLAYNITPIASRKTCVIGLQGVNGGWQRDKTTVILPTGEKEIKKEGHIHLIDDLETWEWKKRVVYLVFDSDVGSKANASLFKQTPRSGAWGAENTLAQLLRAAGATVRIVILPPKIDGTKYGADDLIAERGPAQTLRLIYNNWVIERNVDEVLYQEKVSAIKFEPLVDLVRRAPPASPQVIQAILPECGVAIFGGSSGVGKSLMALQAAQAVATGTRFLDRLTTGQGLVLYIQTELDESIMAQRGKLLDGLSPNIMHFSPGPKMPLNWFEPDGYNKRRDTGSRETVMALLDQIRSYKPKLVIFDPLKDFTSCPLTDREITPHLMQIFRMIARVARCGVLLIHHFRKIGGREGEYEGQDDFYGGFQISAECDGSLGIYEKVRGDGTRRYKLRFTKIRNAAPIEDHELERLSGDDSLHWRAIPWEDHAHPKKISSDDRIIMALESGHGTAGELIERTGIARRTFFDAVSRLQKKGLVHQMGNLYIVHQPSVV